MKITITDFYLIYKNIIGKKEKTQNTGEAWQSLACSPRDIAVTPPSE